VDGRLITCIYFITPPSTFLPYPLAYCIILKQNIVREKELKYGLTKLNIQVYIITVKNMEKECFNGPMDLNLQEISIIIILKVTDYTFGVIKDNTKVNGSIIKCTGKGYLCGPMAKNMKVNTNRIKKKG
jgi:hypothetical protein